MARARTRRVIDDLLRVHVETSQRPAQAKLSVSSLRKTWRGARQMFLSLTAKSDPESARGCSSFAYGSAWPAENLRIRSARQKSEQPTRAGRSEPCLGPLFIPRLRLFMTMKLVYRARSRNI